MNKEQRWEIICKVSAKAAPAIAEISNLIDNIVLDELKYAGFKAYKDGADTGKEFQKVLDTYSFEGYAPCKRVLNYISHYSMYPELAAMQHVELNEAVSVIGEYYDGTPTSVFSRKKQD